MNTPLAGTWLFFHLAATAVLLAEGYPERNLVWKASALWLLALGLTTFFFAPVGGSAAVMWILASLPIMGLTIHQRRLDSYVGCLGTAVAVYAAGLIVQVLLDVHYSHHNYPGKAWPLLDPNNAALVVNFGLIPAFWMSLKDKRFIPLLLLFIGGLLATRSIAGSVAAAGACTTLLAVRFGPRVYSSALALGGFGFIVLAAFKPQAIEYMFYSMGKRYPIWEGAWALTNVMPWTGLGLGSFGYYYQQIRIETESAGWYAHNDLLQFAVEMGFIGAGCFAFLALAVALTFNRRNAVAACCLGAALLQSMVEFQFYVPSISILAGLALAYHRNQSKGFLCKNTSF